MNRTRNNVVLGPSHGVQDKVVVEGHVALVEMAYEDADAAEGFTQRFPGATSRVARQWRCCIAFTLLDVLDVCAGIVVVSVFREHP